VQKRAMQNASQQSYVVTMASRVIFFSAPWCMQLWWRGINVIGAVHFRPFMFCMACTGTVLSALLLCAAPNACALRAVSQMWPHRLVLLVGVMLWHAAGHTLAHQQRLLVLQCAPSSHLLEASHLSCLAIGRAWPSVNHVA
jgi:hypothetical protein